MSLLRYRHVIVWLALVAMISFFAIYIYMIRLPADDKNTDNVFVAQVQNKSVSHEFEIVLREGYALCRKYQFSCGHETRLEGTARKELDNLTKEELQLRFPAADGWNIYWADNKITIEHLEVGLCLVHQKRWHLSTDETGQSLAIYLGPQEVGLEGGLVSVTDIKIAGLPENLQDKIKKGELEFLDWDDLIATLDSLAE